MFSKEFMRYLINYQPEGCETKQVETVKSIEFKDKNSSILAKIYLTINSK